MSSTTRAFRAIKKITRRKEAEKIKLDPNLFRHPKKKNVDVADTSHEAYDKLKEDGVIQTQADHSLWFLKEYLTQEDAVPPTAKELMDWVEKGGFLPDVDDSRAYVARPLSVLRNKGLVRNPPDRLCTIATWPSGKPKKLMTWALVEGEIKKPKRKPMPKKDLFPRIVASMVKGFVLLVSFEMGQGKTLKEAVELHDPYRQLVKYVIYRSVVQGRGLPHPLKVKDE